MSTFAHTRWDTSYFLHRTFYTRCRKAQECASPASVAAVGPHLEFSTGLSHADFSNCHLFRKLLQQHELVAVGRE